MRCHCIFFFKINKGCAMLNATQAIISQLWMWITEPKLTSPKSLDQYPGQNPIAMKGTRRNRNQAVYGKKILLSTFDLPCFGLLAAKAELSITSEGIDFDCSIFLLSSRLTIYPVIWASQVLIFKIYISFRYLAPGTRLLRYLNCPLWLDSCSQTWNHLQ